MGIALALALLLAAPQVDDDAPRTYGALVKRLPKDKSEQRTALLRFADETRASTGDRVRAARASIALLPRDDGARIDGELLVARLEGVRGRDAARRGAIANATRLAKKTKDKREPALAALALADGAHAALTRALKRHRQGTPLSESERALVVIDVHSAAQTALDDDPAAARFALTAAELCAKGDAVDEAIALSARAITFAGDARDATAVVDNALRLRARLFMKKGDIAASAEESLRADMRSVVPPTASAFFTPPERSFARSRITAETCFALAQSGKSCREIEKRLKIAPTFYDFSVEKSDDGFDYERGELALSEASDHLFACVKKAAQDKNFSARRLEIEFTVLNSGRAKKIALKPTRLQGTPLESCVDEALTRVRYPRYDGELHHVVLPFDIGG